MKIFAKAAFSLALIFCVGNLFAQDLDLPKILPEAEFSNTIKDFVWSNMDAEKVGYAAEKFYRIKKSEIENKNQSEFDIETVSKIMRSISKMQGMEYFSRSRKVWNTLYSESFRVDDPDAKKLTAVEDITTGNADGQEIYAFLNDHTFGECIYKISYKQSQKEFLMIMQNHSYISYGLVKAVKPNNLKMCVLIVDDGEDFLFYIGNYTECKIPSMLKTRLNNSFEARLEAIYNWFKTEF